MCLAGLALQAEQHQDLAKSMVVERPKVIFNDLTQQFVMWMHIDDARCACLLLWMPRCSTLSSIIDALCSRSAAKQSKGRGQGAGDFGSYAQVLQSRSEVASN